ncbi:Gfo/Idh/MocA family protein [Mycetocola spongiae]|uniref:Gfo/Idh/MocA family protein n=1 Tax=Mycetocola spongiae TaxID=2859226 RepID=UPI001CF32704|nr:Gfo/Idh/MocA family oxidoreductase [Mycetocola spongiae]UCR90533.1 Gfo/Idh/MocA family oxidoreductase [Mycetocola spongiae]
MGAPLRVGMVGAGAIAQQYLNTFPHLDHVTLVAVADLDHERAETVARSVDETIPGVRALGVDELIADPDVDIVLNLTIPRAHAPIALQAIAAGKHVYGEKPLTATVAEGVEVLAAAQAAGVRVGCAPDTVLGTGVQTARRAVDDGLIGRPISASATMVTPGHERWHPNPDFYYVPGGGPLLDMGPYYVTALVTLLGPVVSVIGAASHTRSEREIKTGPRAGEKIPVTTDSHVTGILTHASGALSTLFMSFDAAATRSSNIEVHGENASLIVPDPNHFAGDVSIREIGAEDWSVLPVSAGYVDASRGVGLEDLAVAAAENRPHRAGAELALHALEIMESVLLSAQSGTGVSIASTVERPEAVDLNTSVSPAPVASA